MNEIADRKDAVRERLRSLTSGPSRMKATEADALASDFAAVYDDLVVGCRIDPALTARAVDRLHKALAGRGLDAAGQARLLRLRAHALFSSGDVSGSLPAYESAAKAFRKLGDRMEEGRTAIGWVFALGMAGRASQARKVAARGIQLLQARDRILQARLEANLGSAWMTVGRLDLVAEQSEKALKLFRAAKSPGDAAVTAHNLGVVFHMLGESKKARKACRQALEFYSGGDDHMPSLYSHTVLAALDIADGDWQRGLNEIERIREVFTSRGDRRGEAWLQRELALLFSSVGASEAGVPAAESALRLYRELGLEMDAAHAECLLGRLLAGQGRHNEALVHLERASRHWTDVGHTWLKHRVNVEMAPVLLAENRADEALARLRKSQGYLDRKSPHSDGALARARAAQAYLVQGKNSRAHQAATRAYADAKKHPAKLERPTMALVRAQAAARLGRDAEAVRWAKRAVDLLEELLLKFGTRQLRILVGGSRAAVYGPAIDVILECGGERAEETAVDLLSRARSPVLIEDLLQGRSSEMLPDTRAAIVRLRDQLLSSNPDEETEDLRSRSLQGQMEQLDKRLTRVLARTPQLVRAAHRDRGFDRWKKHLRGRDVVLYDYHQGWRAFVVRADGTSRFVPLPGGEQALARDWFALRLTFETASRAPKTRRTEFLDRTLVESTKSLESLRRAFWDPLPLNSDHVVVIPLRELHSLPLESMDRNGRTVSRLPHPSLLAQRERKPLQNALLLAGPDDSMSEEIEDVAAQLGHSGFQVETGTGRAALDEVRGPVGALHVAAHGTFHRSGWLMSGLELSDGWVGFEHLRKELLDGALVQFTSCESGVVELMPGSDFDGWIAAALSAGARELVLTAWRIDADAARGFSKPFYERWSTGETAPAAAAKARARLRDLHPHPFHWAPFVVVG